VFKLRGTSISRTRRNNPPNYQPSVSQRPLRLVPFCRESNPASARFLGNCQQSVPFIDLKNRRYPARHSLLDGDAVCPLTALACERYGELDFMVNNAGIGPISLLDDLRV
jgi:hypothetical protein